jgi:hypothetical protein
MYYHSTPSTNLAAIAKEGLKPSKNPFWHGMRTSVTNEDELGKFSMRKVFVSKSLKAAFFYGILRFLDEMRDKKPTVPTTCLLRVKDDVVPFIKDGKSKEDYYATRKIAPKYIEFFNGVEWVPVTDTARLTCTTVSQDLVLTTCNLNGETVKSEKHNDLQDLVYLLMAFNGIPKCSISDLIS